MASQGTLVEIIPAEFTFVSSTMPDVTIPIGRTITITLVGPNQSVSYTLESSDTAGIYSFLGTLTST